MIVGWIGLGRMGGPMVARLVVAGHDVHVWARDPEAARSTIQSGATWAASSGDLARRADVLATMVGGPADVEAILLGADGAIDRMRRNTVAIDFTTSAPRLARRLAGAGRDRGIHVIDAPVSGGPIGAGGGALSIMVGGETHALGRVRPLLEVLGTTIVHHGPAGAGQAAKLANQVLVAASMAGIVEAFETATRLGLEPDAVLKSLDAGIARSPLLTYIWPRLTASDLTPGFEVRHLIKDLELALDAANASGVPLEVTEAVLARYRLLAADGYGEAGTQALLLTARGMRWPTHATPTLRGAG